MEPLKLAIIGYGKMGKEIEKQICHAGLLVGAVIDSEHDWTLKETEIRSCAVAIEFTSPHVTLRNMQKCMEWNLPVVVGTTGWYDHLDQIRDFCLQRNGSLFYASNFSVGVNLFFELNRHLAQLMKDYPEYRLEMEETHHVQKLDAPSGTALSLVGDILEINRSLKGWKLAPELCLDTEIPVVAHRIDKVPGTHVVRYTSSIDTIEITHTAHSREGFARGAVMAAQWLIGKKGVYTMRDLLKR